MILIECLVLLHLKHSYFNNMTTEKKIPASIDEYISDFPANTQTILTELRQTIQKAAPEATEKISWGMPTFYLKGNLIHFAAHKKHIGLYPGAEAIEYFTKDLQDYKFERSNPATFRQTTTFGTNNKDYKIQYRKKPKGKITKKPRKL